MTYSLHRLAEQDLASAFTFYRETGSDKVALRLLTEFERVADVLVANPGLGSPTNDGRRIFHLRSFPYAVIYRPVAAGVRILVLRHQRREPAYGDDRT